MEHAVQVSWEEKMIDWDLPPADDTYPEYAEHNGRELPPGQVLAKKFPVLHFADSPKDADHTEWNLKIHGEIESPALIPVTELSQLNLAHTFTQSMHCVTSWSVLDMDWQGISGQHIVDMVRPADDVTTVMLYCRDEFTVSLWIEDFCKGHVVFGYKGRKLSLNHGYPLRFLAPVYLYQWKSAKWMHSIEFRTDHPVDFWGRRGYHPGGRVDKAERYTDLSVLEKGKSLGQIRTQARRERKRNTIEESTCPYAS